MAVTSNLENKRHFGEGGTPKIIATVNLSKLHCIVNLNLQ